MSYFWYSDIVKWHFTKVIFPTPLSPARMSLNLGVSLVACRGKGEMQCWWATSTKISLICYSQQLPGKYKVNYHHLLLLTASKGISRAIIDFQIWSSIAKKCIGWQMEITPTLSDSIGRRYTIVTDYKWIYTWKLQCKW